MARDPWCGPELEESALPSEVELSFVAAAPHVIAGESVDLVLRLTNRSRRAVAVRFDSFLTPFSRALRVLAATGEDVTVTGDCRTAGSGDAGRRLVLLGADGIAELRHPWRASHPHSTF